MQRNARGGDESVNLNVYDMLKKALCKVVLTCYFLYLCMFVDVSYRVIYATSKSELCIGARSRRANACFEIKLKWNLKDNICSLKKEL